MGDGRTWCSDSCRHRERRARAKDVREPLAARTCARPGCENSFTPEPQHGNRKIYCSTECYRAMDRDAKAGRTPPRTVDELLENERRADAERRHREELKKSTALEGRVRRYLSALELGLSAYDPTPLLVEPNDDPNLPEVDLVLCAGDWHTGAKIKMHETGGVYEQDIETTRTQVFQLWEKIQRLHQVKSTGARIARLYLLGLGDLIDNDDMRPAQHRQVEELVTVQTVQAFDLWTWLIRQCLTIAPEVYVDMVGGNHDRTSRAKGNAGLGELGYEDSFSWLIGEFSKRVFVEESRVSIRNWNTFFGYREIAGQKVVFEHGSSIKWAANSYGGVPWYGVSQLPVKFASMLGASDLFVIGHGHRPAILPHGRGWQVLNGALPATTNYEQSSFKSIHRPMQTLLTLHREHGLVSWEPLYLDVPGTLLPGDVWKDPEGYAELASSR